MIVAQKSVRHVLLQLGGQNVKTYAEPRKFIEKELPEWLRTLIQRRINVQSEYWPQKVLAVATIHAVFLEFIEIWNRSMRSEED
jgi:hypothetical protein